MDGFLVTFVGFAAAGGQEVEAESREAAEHRLRVDAS
jgi:hypothetical protein